MAAAQSRADTANSGKFTLLSGASGSSGPTSYPTLSLCFRPSFRRRNAHAPHWGMLASPENHGAHLRSPAPGPRVHCGVESKLTVAPNFSAGPKLGGNTLSQDHHQQSSDAQDQHAVRFAPTVEEISVAGAEDDQICPVTKASPVQSPSPLEDTPPGFSATRRLSHFHFEPVSLPASRVSPYIYTALGTPAPSADRFG